MLMPSYLLSGEFSPFAPLLLERFRKTLRIKKGETILRMMEDRSKMCYYIISGLVVWALRHENGGEKTSSLRGPGTIFPLYYTYSSTSMEGSLEVIALTDLELLCIPKSELLELMMEVPRMAIAMCDAWGKYATLLLYDMSSNLFDPVNIRVCSYLYIQSLTTGNQISMTHEAIGTAVGATRVTVSKVLGSLAKEGIIKTGRKGIRILSTERLLQYCSYTARPK